MFKPRLDSKIISTVVITFCIIFGTVFQNAYAEVIYIQNPNNNSLAVTSSEYIKEYIDILKEQSKRETKSYTEEELETLAIVIYQEHGDDNSSDETRIKIGNVVMNRVASPLFPNTIKEVALQESQWGLLSITGIVWQDRAFNESEQEAVQRAYDCALRVLEGESLLPENVVWAAQFSQGNGIYEIADGTYFCY